MTIIASLWVCFSVKKKHKIKGAGNQKNRKTNLLFDRQNNLKAQEGAGRVALGYCMAISGMALKP